jgi:hypothetical protein
MMNYLKRGVLITIALCVTGLAHAEAPFVDYQWAKSSDACLERANDSLIDAGFEITSKGEIEVVGTKGNYKGVIACIDEGGDMAVFMVAGSSYNQAQQYALRLKNNFLK